MRKKGILLIITSSLFFALMAASVKFLDGYPLFEKVFFRNFVGLLFAYYLIRKNDISIKPNNFKFISLRSVFGLIGVILYFYTLSRINLADAVILNKTSPFFVILFSILFLRERIKGYQIISILIAATGVILVIKPTFDVDTIPYMIGLGAAAFAGAAYTTIRYLKDYDDPRLIVFYFCLFSVVVTFPLMILNGFILPAGVDLIALLAIGIFATIAQISMTSAYRYAPASELSIYTYMNIVFSSIIAFVFWKETLDVLSLIGAMAIMSGGYMNFHFGNRKPNSMK